MESIIICGFGKHWFVDQHGKPIQRTPYEYPYSFSPYLVYRNGKNEEAKSCIYSDHLYKFSHGENSYKHYENMRMKHFGNHSQQWDDVDETKIEEFLRDYFDKPKLKLVYMMKGCNVSSGYPIWEFHVNMGD